MKSSYRGFIRTYASEIGLDPDIAVAEYEDLTGEKITKEQHQLPALSPEYKIIGAALGALVILVIGFYVSIGFMQGNQETTEGFGLNPAGSETEAQLQSSTILNQPAPRKLVAQPAEFGKETRQKNVSISIQVHDITWVAVSADGREVVGGEILNAGATRQYTADEVIELTIGNAAGLSLRINDHEIPSLGKAGQVRILTITPDNIERYTGTD